MSTFFSLSTHWKSYDVFSRQKLSTFKSSRAAVLELAVKYKELIVQLEDGSATSKDAEELEIAERLLFTEMCEICLWGNATDLSLLTSLTYEDIQKLQGSEARKSSEKRILVNDLSSAYQVLKTAQQTNGKKGVELTLYLTMPGSSSLSTSSSPDISSPSVSPLKSCFTQNPSPGLSPMFSPRTSPPSSTPSQTLNPSLAPHPTKTKP